MDITPQLPCGHEYCKSCMAQLREKGVAQTCPLCRKPLPPGPDKLYDLGYRIYAKIMAVVDPNYDASWENISLSPAQQEGMDQSRALLLEGLATGTRDLTATLGRVCSLASRGALRNDDLVDERNVRLDVEQGGGQLNRAGLLAVSLVDVERESRVSHDQAPFTALRT